MKKFIKKIKRNLWLIIIIIGFCAFIVNLILLVRNEFSLCSTKNITINCSYYKYYDDPFKETWNVIPINLKNNYVLYINCRNGVTNSVTAFSFNLNFKKL